MRLKLKEDPKEWLKFACALTGAVWLATGLLWYRGKVTPHSIKLVAAVSLALLALGLMQPRLVRPLYRGAMTVGFHVGQVVGKVILGVLFVLVVTPLGMVLRLAGKDLLRLRRDPKVASHWQPARPASQLDRQF